MSPRMVLTKPKEAEVFSPLELIRGLFINAKYALYIRAVPSTRNRDFFLSNKSIGDGMY
jgi:hypothetical protein